MHLIKHFYRSSWFFLFLGFVANLFIFTHRKSVTKWMNKPKNRKEKWKRKIDLKIVAKIKKIKPKWRKTSILLDLFLHYSVLIFFKHLSFLFLLLFHFLAQQETKFSLIHVSVQFDGHVQLWCFFKLGLFYLTEFIYLYTFLVCLSVCLFIRLYQMNIKRPKFCAGPHMNPEKV